MLKRWQSLCCLLAFSAILIFPASADVTSANPWLSPSRSPLNIAHQGGEIEHPSNTMFAFKEALRKGADVIELDIHATKDGHIVVLHDSTVHRTTDRAGRVDSLTLSEIKSLDAAYWFIAGVGTINCHCGRDDSEYTWRGVATGASTPPLGYSAEDFQIPTLREVLDEFPEVPINIEIKNSAPDTIPYEKLLADLLQEFQREDDVIVVSFLDHALETFKLHAPKVHTATATAQTAAFWASAQGPGPGAPNPRYVALQVPITFQGITVLDEAGRFIAKANAAGLAVHAWTIDDRATMERLLDRGIQGIMTNRPSLLEDVLNQRAASSR